MKTLIEQYNEARTKVGRRMSWNENYVYPPLYGPVPLNLIEPVYSTQDKEYFIEVYRSGGVPYVGITFLYKKEFRPMRIREF